MENLIKRLIFPTEPVFTDVKTLEKKHPCPRGTSYISGSKSKQQRNFSYLKRLREICCFCSLDSFPWKVKMLPIPWAKCLGELAGHFILPVIKKTPTTIILILFCLHPFLFQNIIIIGVITIQVTQL